MSVEEKSLTFRFWCSICELTPRPQLINQFRTSNNIHYIIAFASHVANIGVRKVLVFFDRTTHSLIRAKTKAMYVYACVHGPKLINGPLTYGVSYVISSYVCVFVHDLVEYALYRLVGDGMKKMKPNSVCEHH